MEILKKNSDTEWTKKFESGTFMSFNTTAKNGHEPYGSFQLRDGKVQIIRISDDTANDEMLNTQTAVSLRGSGLNILRN